MNNLKCPGCGLVNFSTAESCKRCAAPLAAEAECAAAPEPAEALGVAADEAPAPRTWSVSTKAAVAFVALLAAAVVVFVSAGGTAPAAPPYAELIRVSEPFSQPMMIKVNQRAFPEGSPRHELRVVPEAYALETLGLLRIEEKAVRVEVQRTPGQPASLGFRDDPDIAYMTKLASDISLTAKGREASADWEVSSEGSGKQQIDWWHVPVGHRELVSVGAAGPGPKGEGGRELWAVNFKWRWVPNEIGAGFDRANAASAKLPGRARYSRLSRRDSTREYDGLAWFGRKGEAWELVEVFCEVHFDEYERKFIPVEDSDFPHGP